MTLTPSKLTRVAAACVVLSANDFGGQIPSLANGVELKAKIEQDGFVRMPIKKVAYEFTQV